MAVTTAIPARASRPPPEPRIAISFSGAGGSAADDRALAACVLDVSIDRTVDQADHLAMRLAAWDPDTGNVAWLDDARLAAGAALVVQLGYGEILTQVFDGDIVGVGLELRAGEPAVMTVDAYNRIHRLGRNRPPPATTPEQNATYGDVITKIAKRYGLGAKVDSNADKKNPTVVQQNESDLAFLRKLAEEIGYMFYVDGSDLVFSKDTPSAGATVTIPATELVELSGHVDPSSQVGVLVGSGFDHDSNEPISDQASNPDSFDRAFGNEDVVVTHPLAVNNKEQLKERLEAELRRVRNSYLSVTATCFGRTDVALGMLIKLTGIASRFDGEYTVTGVTQSFSQSAGFRTRLTLKGMKGSRP